MNFPVLALVGAGVGFFLGGKDDSLRNALIGGAAGFALDYFSKGASAALPQGAMATLPPGEELPENEQSQEQQEQVPQSDVPVEQQGGGAVLVGKDYFPIGAVALLASPYRTYDTKVVTEIEKKSNGNWLTQPGGVEYFTSVKKIVERGIDVGAVVSADNKLLWSKEWAQSNPLAAYAI